MLNLFISNDNKIIKEACSHQISSEALQFIIYLLINLIVIIIIVCVCVEK